MKIYTRTGDEGETGLRDGTRLAKDELLLDTIGTIDELNCALGLVRTELLPAEIDSLLERLQNDLFIVGAELAMPGEAIRGPTIGPQHVEYLEQAIDRHQASLPALTQFILPGGTRAAAALHFARSVCRRAGRRLVALARGTPAGMAHDLIPYLNRVSDLLFVLARAANAHAGRGDVIWRKDA
jgi:cob(I)alamin adenosyltransferase